MVGWRDPDNVQLFWKLTKGAEELREENHSKVFTQLILPTLAPTFVTILRVFGISLVFWYTHQN